MSVSTRAHAQFSNMHRTKTHLNVPRGGNDYNTVLYLWKLLLVMNRVEWMKGICHIWSRGRHFSPSMPGDRYLKLSSQKRSPGRNLGEHRSVRRSGTASRGTALLVFCMRMRSFSRAQFLTIFLGKNIRVGSTKYKTLLMAFIRASLLRYVHIPVV